MPDDSDEPARAASVLERSRSSETNASLAEFIRDMLKAQLEPFRESTSAAVQAILGQLDARIDALEAPTPEALLKNADILRDAVHSELPVLRRLSDEDNQRYALPVAAPQ